MILIKGNGGENTEAKIAAFEKKWNISVPEPYRSFWCRYNGGVTDDAFVNFIEEEDNGTDVRKFYGLGTEKTWDDLNHYPYMDEWIENEVPTLPIARNIWGELIVIGLEGEERGKVFLVPCVMGFHDDEEPWLLGRSFEEFMERCYINKEGWRRRYPERKDQP